MTGAGRRLLRRAVPAAARARLSPMRLRLAARGVYRRRVFCIGRNKTGTTTLEAVLRHYRFRLGPQIEAERLVAEGDAGPGFWAWVERHEAFQDVPFSATWLLPELVRRHPDARYILTLRDPEDWFESLANHHFSLFGLPRDAPREEVARALRRMGTVPGALERSHRRQYGIEDDSRLYDRARYVANFRAHADAARALVPADRLLEIDLSEHADTAALCRFLGIPEALAIPMPRENRRR